ncbi:beta-galactosidase [Ardenticatena maritima]|uniref:Beta-galactosidase n=1 Tax=Ardenticatena maritima TaxID=872965 RepID=A0A0M8K813_9CHLR|nr:beta-galactosidase [Ardenticatena maritima]GAP62711.1 beta-galactosidase [Ardenticatena maritima]
MSTTFGVAYYPEHWPETRWATDARLMREAGIDTVRLAEFAWAQMEPAPGDYTFDWLDRAVELFAQEGFRIIMCTPTAAPPAWLVQRYPDMLPVDDQGRRRAFGSRRHVCPNHAGFHAETERIVRVLGERYGAHPAVIGWQLDNEWGGGRSTRCYCPNCVAAFRRWLQARYGSLDALNDAWGADFWSQRYTAWEQIGAPILTVSTPNPSHVLDYYRFMSDAWVAYQQRQIDVLRPLLPEGRFITHNFMGLFDEIDYHALAQPLDFITWDSYPTGHEDRWSEKVYTPDETPPPHAYDTGDPFITEMAHDVMRGLQNKPFWVMEQQCGFINWGFYNQAPRPAVIRLWSWQAVAHGADALVYFRWRAVRYAQEQFHSGLLRHDGEPADGWHVVRRLQAERALLERLQATQTPAEVAMLLAYDDLWALDLQPHHREFRYWRHFGAYYRALRRAGVDVDIVAPRADLSRYKLVIAPTLYLVDDALAAHLHAYVAQGGHLVLGVRSGFKTPTNLVTEAPLPGALRALVGARVEAWHSLPPTTTYRARFDHLHETPIHLWAEALTPETAAPVGFYTTSPLAPHAAMTEHVVGKGLVTYVGVWPSRALLDTFVPHWLDRAHVARLLTIPDGVTVASRQGEEGRYLFICNWTEQVARVFLPVKGKDALSGAPVGGDIPVPPLDVRILIV